MASFLLLLAWDDLKQIFSASEQPKPGMSFQKISYMSSLLSGLKTNWMKLGRICQ